MSNFVNFSKRDFLLPPGCKDLIDVLQPREVPRPIKSIASASERPAVTRGRTTISRLADVPHHVARLVKSRSQFFTLMISTMDQRLSIVLSRSESEGVRALVFVSGDAERERAIRQFFQRQGTNLLQDYLLPSDAGAEPVRGLVYPLPPAPPQAAQITCELLQSVYGFTDESQIRFLYYEVG